MTDPGNDDQLLVGIGNNVIGQFDLASVQQSGTQTIWQGGVVPGVAGDAALFGASVGNGTATVTMDAPRSLSSLTFSPATGGSYALSGSAANSLQLANGGSSASVSVTGGVPRSTPRLCWATT